MNTKDIEIKEVQDPQEMKKVIEKDVAKLGVVDTTKTATEINKSATRLSLAIRKGISPTTLQKGVISPKPEMRSKASPVCPRRPSTTSFDIKLPLSAGSSLDATIPRVRLANPAPSAMANPIK